jgi:ATP-dependent 26S proteasome regulatory subunit
MTQFMLELDQISVYDDRSDMVILLAATNHPQVIDPSILRSGKLLICVEFVYG